jgi:hypothetical protein
MEDASDRGSEPSGVRRDPHVDLGSSENPHSTTPEFGDAGQPTTHPHGLSNHRVGIRRAIVPAAHPDKLARSNG